MRLYPLAIIIILLSVVLPYSMAAGPSTTTLQSGCVINGLTGTPESCINAAVSMAAIGILMSLMMVALSYMIGEVAGINKLKNWYKGELWETIKSLLIIGSILSVLIILSGISLTLAGGTSSSTSLSTNLQGLWNTAYNKYITNPNSNSNLCNSQVTGLQISECSMDAVLGLSMGVGALSSLRGGLNLSLQAFWINVISGSSGNLYNTQILLNPSLGGNPSLLGDIVTIIVVPMEILFVFLSKFFYSIVAIGIAVFLPMGIFLRSMPFLRGLGGTFIAMGIGLAIVFPALLVMMNLPVTNYVGTMLYSSPPAQTSHSYPTLLNFIENTMNSLLNDITTALNNALNTPLLVFTNGMLIGFVTGISNIYSILNYATYYTLMDILQFILLVIDIILTFVISNNIALLMGGRIKLGIGKFKLA